ncbi:hypothetical protein Neosp_008220 [[Neocosmospora] mangrovei]
MVKAIGILGAVVSVFTVLDTAFKYVPKGRNSVVSVRAALDKKDGSAKTGGKIGLIQTWNNNLEKLGEESNWKIDQGGIIEVEVSQRSSQQATKPFCTWIDGDGTNGLFVKSFRIHFPTFAPDTKTPYSKNPKSYCGKHGFLGYRDLQMRQPVRVPNNSKKPVGPQRRSTSGTRVIVTKEAGYNTTELCTSETSWGPDFVSLDEGLYCDMDSRELLPVCHQDKDIAPCFDAKAIKVDYGDKVERDAIPQQKEFTEVIQW